MRFVVCAERVWSPVALVRFDTGPVQFTGHTGICQTNNGITCSRCFHGLGVKDGRLAPPGLAGTRGMNAGKSRRFGDDRNTLTDRPRTLADPAVHYDHDDAGSRLDGVRLQQTATDLLDGTNSVRYRW
jgi:hypothetical protein